MYLIQSLYFQDLGDLILTLEPTGKETPEGSPKKNAGQNGDRSLVQLELNNNSAEFALVVPVSVLKKLIILGLRFLGGDGCGVFYYDEFREKNESPESKPLPAAKMLRLYFDPNSYKWPPRPLSHPKSLEETLKCMPGSVADSSAADPAAAPAPPGESPAL